MGTEDTGVPIPEHLRSATGVLKRGLRESPELRTGIGWTIGMAMAGMLGRLVIPILIQQILDRGIRGPSGFRPEIVYPACGIGLAAIVLVYLASRGTYLRLVRAAENALTRLRVRTFAHIHQLSIAEQTNEKRGVFVSRVTADIDTLAMFMEWGGLSWITSISLMLGTLVAMFVVSWQLTLVVLVVVFPLVFVVKALQKGLLSAYDRVRTRVGDTLGEVSESVMGAAVIRAYGLEERTDRRLKRAIDRQYRAQLRANKFMSGIFPMNDLFGAAAVAATVYVGARYGPGMGLSLGRVIAFLFFVTLFLEPVAQMSETFDQTQTAIAGWRKVLTVIDLPVEIVEPDPGLSLPPGAVGVVARDVDYGYSEGGLVLHGVSAEIPAGAHVAIVGETGSGKTTFAKLLARLADPAAGSICIGGSDLREIASASRRAAVRMVPQDGFLFDTTVAENVRMGAVGATGADVNAAFGSLGLDWWVRTLPDGLATRVGERGESLSVGERQLVALARAQLADPGLLILDEATSAVDPETERALSIALARLGEGRTTVAIAHRLSTAEAADMVLVFDRGRIVERGTHRDLVARGGVYASLYESWLGNTQAA